jgi:hypothetical protein
MDDGIAHILKLSRDLANPLDFSAGNRNVGRLGFLYPLTDALELSRSVLNFVNALRVQLKVLEYGCEFVKAPKLLGFGIEGCQLLDGVLKAADGFPGIDWASRCRLNGADESLRGGNGLAGHQHHFEIKGTGEFQQI